MISVRASSAASDQPVIGGCRLIPLPRICDERGTLVFGQRGGLPFPVKQFFMILDVPDGTVRGGHAHRELHELLIAVRGTVSCDLYDGQQKACVLLDDPAVGLYVPPRVFGTFRFMDGILLVLASHEYEPDDYIRDRHALGS